MTHDEIGGTSALGDAPHEGDACTPMELAARVRTVALAPTGSVWRNRNGASGRAEPQTSGTHHGDGANVAGFNISADCGDEAGQATFSARVHLIPLRKGDSPDSHGGVRGVMHGRTEC